MAAAIAAITIGGIMVASGLKGVSVTALIGNTVGRVLNPAGGKKEFDWGEILDTAPGMSGGGPTGEPFGTGTIGASVGDAKALVDYLVQVAQTNGGGGIYIASSIRPGASTSSGNLSDHSSNTSERAARDIAVKGVDAIKGPPMPELDRAIVAIGKALGRGYKARTRIVDTFTKNGLRIQVIWRTPEYGGHMGHIHVGAHKV